MNWLKKLFGKRKRQTGRWVMRVDSVMTNDEATALRTFLRLQTPVITAAQYNKLPVDCKKLFIKVGGGK